MADIANIPATAGGAAASGGWEDIAGYDPLTPNNQNVIDVTADLDVEDIELSGPLSNVGGAGGYDILPRINGSTANFQITRVVDSVGGAFAAPTSLDGIASGLAGSIFTVRYVRFYGHPNIGGTVKRGWGEFNIVRDDGGAQIRYEGTFEWNVTGTKASSVGLQAGAGAGQFRSGRLWARKRTRA